MSTSHFHPATPARRGHHSVAGAAHFTVNRASRTGRREPGFEGRLATRIVHGHLDAAVELRDRYEAELLEIAVAKLGDPIEAERIVEAALEDACHGWPPARGEVARWLRALVRRRARSRRRVLWGLDS